MFLEPPNLDWNDEHAIYAGDDGSGSPEQDVAKVEDATTAAAGSQRQEPHPTFKREADGSSAAYGQKWPIRESSPQAPDATVLTTRLQTDTPSPSSSSLSGAPTLHDEEAESDGEAEGANEAQPQGQVGPDPLPPRLRSRSKEAPRQKAKEDGSPASKTARANKETGFIVGGVTLLFFLWYLYGLWGGRNTAERRPVLELERLNTAARMNDNCGSRLLNGNITSGVQVQNALQKVNHRLSLCTMNGRKTIGSLTGSLQKDVQTLLAADHYEPQLRPSVDQVRSQAKDTIACTSSALTMLDNTSSVITTGRAKDKTALEATARGWPRGGPEGEEVGRERDRLRHSIKELEELASCMGTVGKLIGFEKERFVGLDADLERWDQYLDNWVVLLGEEDRSPRSADGTVDLRQVEESYLQLVQRFSGNITESQAFMETWSGSVLKEKATDGGA